MLFNSSSKNYYNRYLFKLVFLLFSFEKLYFKMFSICFLFLFLFKFTHLLRLFIWNFNLKLLRANFRSKKIKQAAQLSRYKSISVYKPTKVWLGVLQSLQKSSNIFCHFLSRERFSVFHFSFLGVVLITFLITSPRMW